TASAFDASAPRPYTVSVGNATRPPARSTSTARVSTPSPVVDARRSLGHDVEIVGPRPRRQVLPTAVGQQRDDRAALHRRGHLRGARDCGAGRDAGEDAALV